MPRSTASSIVRARARSCEPAELADTSKAFSIDSTSTEMNFARPVKFRQTSITVTARNIRYRVDTSTPACDRPSRILRGCARNSLSMNINPMSSITAHHPAALASPAAFCRSWIIQGSDVILQTSPVCSTTAPSMTEIQLQPTESFGVRSRTRTRSTGAKICIRWSRSCRFNRMSSVNSPIASIFCLRA